MKRAVFSGVFLVLATMCGAASARGVDQGGSLGLTGFGGIGYTGGLDFPVGGGVGVTWFHDDERPMHHAGAEVGWLLASGKGFVRPYYGYGFWWLTAGTGLIWGMEKQKVFGVSPELTFHLRRRSGVWRPAAQVYLQGMLVVTHREAFPDFIGAGLRILIDL